MGRPSDAELEEASSKLARVIWELIQLIRHEHKARGLLGKATRKELVHRILALAKLLRDADSK